jgi:hypothetical protein
MVARGAVRKPVAANLTKKVPNAEAAYSVDSERARVGSEKAKADLEKERTKRM